MTPESRDRGIDRAILADELDDEQIATEYDTSREFVSRRRSRLRLERALQRGIENAVARSRRGGR